MNIDKIKRALFCSAHTSKSTISLAKLNYPKLLPSFDFKKAVYSFFPYLEVVQPIQIVLRRSLRSMVLVHPLRYFCSQVICSRYAPRGEEMYDSLDNAFGIVTGDGMVERM